MFAALLVFGATGWLAYPRVQAWRSVRSALAIHEGDTRQQVIQKIGIPDYEGLTQFTVNRKARVMVWNRPAMHVRIALDPSGKVEHINVVDLRSD